jgi:hypothetical protein
MSKRRVTLKVVSVFGLKFLVLKSTYFYLKLVGSINQILVNLLLCNKKLRRIGKLDLFKECLELTVLFIIDFTKKFPYKFDGFGCLISI